MSWLFGSRKVAPVNNNGKAVASAAENKGKVYAVKEMLLKLKEMDVKEHEIDEIKKKLDVLAGKYLGNSSKTFENAKKDSIVADILKDLESKYGKNLRFAKNSNIQSKTTLRLQRASNALRKAGNTTRKAISGTAAATGRALGTAAVRTGQALSSAAAATRKRLGNAASRAASASREAASAFGSHLKETGAAASKSASEHAAAVSKATSEAATAAYKGLMSKMPSAKAKQLLEELKTASPEKRDGLKREIVAELDRLVKKPRIFGGISQNTAGSLRMKVSEYIRDLESKDKIENINLSTPNSKKRLEKFLENNNSNAAPAVGTSGNGSGTPRAEANQENNATGNPFAPGAEVPRGGGRTRRNRRYRRH